MYNMWYVKLQIHKFNANTFDMHILKHTYSYPKLQIIITTLAYFFSYFLL